MKVHNNRRFPVKQFFIEIVDKNNTVQDSQNHVDDVAVDQPFQRKFHFGNQDVAVQKKNPTQTHHHVRMFQNLITIGHTLEKRFKYTIK